MIEHNEFREKLQQEIDELKQLRNTLEESLTNTPEGSLHIIQKPKKTPQYYYYATGEKRKYIRKKDIEIAAHLAQKEYDTKLLRIVEKRINAGLEMLKNYSSSLKQVFEELPPAKRKLVEPFEISDQDYIKAWYEENPGGMNSYPINTNLYTNRGEHMRSKSEKIIADLFDKYDLPYVYEPRIDFSNGRFLYPDFMVLNVRERRCFVYEHFGMLSDSQYGEKTSEKISMYIVNGFYPGIDLLFSMESDMEILNTRVVERLIKRYLL